MKLSTEQRKEIFKKHSIHQKDTDTGSAESQIALFTDRINLITSHLKTHKKDFGSKMGLIKIVGKRKKQLNHLQTTDVGRYRKIIADLEIRK